MKPFNLDEYLKNPDRRVITRDGRSARIICADFNNKNYPVIVEVEGIEGPVSVTREGRHMSSSIVNNLDIFFASEKHEGWATIYGKFLTGEIFSTKEEAEESVKRCGEKDFVAIAKVEWEE